MENIGQMVLLKCDLNFGLPVLTVITIIHSLWASSYFLIGLKESYIYDVWTWRDDYFIEPIISTYYLLCLSTTIMLYYGFKNADKNLIQYWHLFKLVECGLIITGILLFATRLFWFYMLIAVPILSTGCYIKISIQEGYHELGIALDPISISNICNHFKRSNQSKDSPPYEAVETTQENLNPLAANTLHFWGFIKIFEFVIISPGIVLIIIITCSSNYWNMFYIIAGLGLCFAVCINFVWTMIPKKSTGRNVEQETEEIAVNSE